jgi:hypothetical protein
MFNRFKTCLSFLVEKGKKVSDSVAEKCMAVIAYMIAALNS